MLKRRSIFTKTSGETLNGQPIPKIARHPLKRRSRKEKTVVEVKNENLYSKRLRDLEEKSKRGEYLSHWPDTGRPIPEALWTQSRHEKRRIKAVEEAVGGDPHSKKLKELEEKSKRGEYLSHWPDTGRPIPEALWTQSRHEKRRVKAIEEAMGGDPYSKKLKDLGGRTTQKG